MKSLWNRVFAGMACLGSFLSFSNRAWAQDQGMIGAKLSYLEKTNDFFLFFNFAPIGGENSSAGTRMTSFKPTGDAFRALVTLIVTTDGKGTVQKLRLMIARSFIDDPKKCVYAADLANSFLLKAATTSPGDDVSSLAGEITARSMAGSTTTILIARPPAQVPATPSAAYRTYAGDSQPRTLTYKPGRRQVSLQNEAGENEPVLVLTVSATSAGI